MTTETIAKIQRIPTTTLIVPIKGLTPLIMHKFDEKAKRMLLEAQQGKKKVKEIRDPEDDYQRCFYRMDMGDGSDHYGFPVVAFKAATVSAARFMSGKNMTMTGMKQALFFKGAITPADSNELVEIVGEPRMREDMVRLGGPSRSADVRYRPEFPEWSATLEVTYVEALIDCDTVVTLIDAAGQYVGVGEWRPQKDGTFGTYCIDQDKEVKVIRA